MMHGWQSESADGLKGGWSCIFFFGGGEWLQWLQWSAGCSVYNVV